MAKRNFLIWGDSDAGKSTLAATLMAPITQRDGTTRPARWPRVHWYNLDKPGVGSIAGYFREGTGARLFEFDIEDWEGLANALRESAEVAKRGDLDAIVLEGLSVRYRDDVGLAALDKPAAITAGGNATRGLYKEPTLKLEAVIAGVRRVSTRAKNPDFVTVLTAHAKEIGDGSKDNPRKTVPDASRNAWKQFVRLCEVVFKLKRKPKQPPEITYSSVDDDMVLARINNDQALAFFDQFHDARDAERLAQLRTMAGIVALLEHGERMKEKRAAEADAKAAQKTSET